MQKTSSRKRQTKYSEWLLNYLGLSISYLYIWFMIKRYTKEEVDFLKDNYPNKGLKHCAKLLGRNESAVRSKVSLMGLKQNKDGEFFKEWQEKAKKSKIGKKRPEHSILMKQYAKDGRLDNWIKKTDEQKKNISERSKDWLKNNPHPKGMKGKTHNEDFKQKISKRNKDLWSDKDSYFNSEKHRQNLSDNMAKNQKLGTLRSGYSRGKQGYYDINGNSIFFRSLWEANYALYLDFLKTNKNISDWSFEQETFWFENIKRGVRSYKPDFKVINLNNTVEYHEVKGWMDAKSKTKLKRMKIYYPEIKMVLIDQKSYKDIKSKLGKILNFF